LSLGLSQTASAGVIGTQMVIQSEARDARITRVEATLARNDVARQLVLFGVDPLAVKSRVGNMTEAELIQLEGRLDQQVAGGSAVAIVGAVFIVLIILEIVGITDIFKSA
jgi:hypothetical protein